MTAGESRSRAIDARVTLASSLHASPGVYALLVGSGVSTGSGVPTGWSVAQQLTKRVAALQTPDDAVSIQAAADDPEGWWHSHFDSPFGYSALLAALAPTPSARQALLAPFFEASDEDREQGLKVPSPAHRAIASLVARGTIRLILTTNFDRLLERALEDAGVSPQVIHRPEQLTAATPLAHARATVIKLHGDYADLDQRNTTDELSSYPESVTTYLAQVLRDYGLLISGWSGDWDQALVNSIEESESRRYPMFWASLGEMSETARRLTAQHSAIVISGVTADELFEDLAERLSALDRLSEPPISRDTAVTRLKRYLADPTRRIDLFDLVDGETSNVVAEAGDVQRFPLARGNYEVAINGRRTAADTLLHLLAQGVFHDDGTHDELWVRTIQRLLNIRGSFFGEFNEALEEARHLPALLAFWVSGVAAIGALREDVLALLLTRPSWRSMFGDQHPQRPAEVLNPNRVLANEGLLAFDRWGGQRWLFAASHYLRETCREPLAVVLPEDNDYRRACDRLEYIASMSAMTIDGRFPYPWAGEFMGDWAGRNPGELHSQIESEIGPNWPYVASGTFGDSEAARHAQEALKEWMVRNPRF